MEDTTTESKTEKREGEQGLHYPTEDDLKRIREWSDQDWFGLMDFIAGLWEFKSWGWSSTGRVYKISTGGWSGNEEIIEALQDSGNGIFWAMCWQSSRRGGHYVFELPSYVTRKEK